MGKNIIFYTKGELTKPIFAIARDVTAAGRTAEESEGATKLLDQYMNFKGGAKNQKSKNIQKNITYKVAEFRKKKINQNRE